MKAKRQILSLLLVLLMVWQGFSYANAETGTSGGTTVVASGSTGTGTEASAAQFPEQAPEVQAERQLKMLYPM